MLVDAMLQLFLNSSKIIPWYILKFKMYQPLDYVPIIVELYNICTLKAKTNCMVIIITFFKHIPQTSIILYIYNII